MNMLITIERAPEVLFHYHAMFTTPAGSAGAHFDLSIDKSPTCMEAGSAQRVTQTSPPIFVAVAWNEMSVPFDMTLAGSAFTIDHGR